MTDSEKIKIIVKLLGTIVLTMAHLADNEDHEDMFDAIRKLEKEEK